MLQNKINLVIRLINHDITVCEENLHTMVEFAQNMGFNSVTEYYFSLSMEKLQEIEYDYFGEITI